MPKELASTLAYEKNGVKIWMNKTVDTFINQLIRVYDLDMKNETSLQVKDVRALKDFSISDYDWEKEIEKLPRRKDGNFYDFRMCTLYEADAFEQAVSKGIKKIQPMLKMHACGGNDVMVYLDWWGGNERILTVKGFRIKELAN